MLNETERRRFLAALQQDDEFRAAVRGQLLGDDLLALPETVKGLAASTKQLARTAVELTKGLADLSRTVEALAGRVDRRFDAVDRRFDAVDKRFDAVDRRFDAVDERFDGLEARFDRLEGRFGNLDGRDYERTAREQAASFLSSVPGRLRRIRVVDTSDLADRLDDAVDDGRIVSPERDDALGADLVCTARRWPGASSAADSASSSCASPRSSSHSPVPCRDTGADGLGAPILPGQDGRFGADPEGAASDQRAGS